MGMMHLAGRAMPYSDWQARVQRILDRRFRGEFTPIVEPSAYWHGLYACGKLPVEAADAYMEDE